MSEIPSELKYTKSHEWVRSEEDGTVTLQVAQGGTFSYYEFPWPMADRLTNEKWRAMVTAGEQPGQPEWTTIFVSE